MKPITTRGFFFRIILPSLLTIVLFVAILFFLIVPFFEDAILERKREMIRELTYSAWSVLSELETEEREGKLARQEAQQRAIARIQFLRYGDEGKDYFWITDMGPRMVVHPYLPELNNQSLTEYEDPTGKRMFVEFVDVVKRDGEGFVDYMWQWKDDDSRIVPKLSFVKQFEPWGWIIGTGIYIEDVKEEINAITRKLVLISLLITILVALLLAFITWQSSAIEAQRVRAENELRASREKYKTLVEASTEGFIMLANNRAFYSNQKIQDLLGYSASEFVDISLGQLFGEAFLDQPFWNDFLTGADVPEQHPSSIQRKDGASLDILLTVSKATLAGKDAQLLIIKDVHRSGDEGADSEQLDVHYHSLIKGIGAAVFVSSLDKRPAILHANPAMAALLGCEQADALMSKPVESFFTDGATCQQFFHSLGHEKRAQISETRLRREDGSLFHASITAAAQTDRGAYPVWFMAIVKDISDQKAAESRKDALNTELQTALFRFMQPAVNYATDPVTVKLGQPAHIAISLMQAKRASAVLALSDDGAAVGIFTDRDIHMRLAGRDCDFDRPVYELMSSPLLAISDQALLAEAALMMSDHGIRHLPVRAKDGAIVGVITDKQLMDVQSLPPNLLAQKIRAASSPVELNECRERAATSVHSLLKSGARAQSITRIISETADEITKRTIQFAVEKLGPPPVRFSFIALGSQGRGEQTLSTDQDNAIIYEDVGDGQQETVTDYFSALARTVCANLDHSGYSLCKGGVMAMNPKWLQPVSVWKEYFSDWTSNPDPQAFLDLKIFFDFRHLVGDANLADELKQHIHAVSEGKAAFYQCLAQNTLLMKPPLGLFGKIVVQTKEGHPETFDIKEAMIPIVDFARLYALHHTINETHTVKRLEAMRERGVLSESAYENAAQTYEFLMQLRLTHQSSRLNQHETTDNFINPKQLSELDGVILKKGFSYITDMQSKISYDFTGSA